MKKIIALAAVAIFASASIVSAHPIDRENRREIQRAFDIRLGDCVQTELRNSGRGYGSTKERTCVAWTIIRSSNARFPVGNTFYIAPSGKKPVFGR
jgi:hypothetical protein